MPDDARSPLVAEHWRIELWPFRVGGPWFVQATGTVTGATIPANDRYSHSSLVAARATARRMLALLNRPHAIMQHHRDTAEIVERRPDVQDR
jgi:hypothetical protein